jgi:sulfur-oxidizing protein SoxB
VRVGGLTYTCDPGAKMGGRITDLRLKGRPLEAGKTYKVAGWAPVAEEATRAGHPMVWDLVETWLKDQGRNPGGRVKARSINTPRLLGMQGNPGLA